MGISPASPAWIRAHPLDGTTTTDAEVIRVLDELEKKQVVHFFEHHGTVLMAIDPFPGDRVGNERYGPRKHPMRPPTFVPPVDDSPPILNPGAIQAAPRDLDPPRDLPVEDDDFPDDFLEPPKNDPV